MSYYFGEKTWVELEEYIRKNTAVIIPIGTTEEHGHHLPVQTDALIAKYYGDCLGKACEDANIPVLVTETITYGFSMSVVRNWPGCPCISTRTFMDYIYDMTDSLVKMGFKKIVMLDCHGNHDCLLRTVMREIADAHSVYMMTLSPSQLSAKRYNEIKKDPQGEIHGGEWETSAIMHIRPELVHRDMMTGVDAIRCNTPLRGPVSAWGLQKTTTWLFGDPTYATPELGAEVFRAATQEGLKMVKMYYDHTEQSGK